MAADPSTNIDSVLQEQRKFECPEHFRQQAHIKSLEEYERLYRESVEQPEKFWGRIANELHWFKKWDKVLEWNHPWAKWFVGGQTQSLLQLPRPPRADLRARTRPPSSGKASPAKSAPSPTSNCIAKCRSSPTS